MSLEGGPFSEEGFAKEFGDNVVLFAHVTSRIPGRENDDMLGTVGGRGFPTIAFMSAEGDLIGMHQGSRDPEGFNGTLTKVNALLSAEKKLAAGDATAGFAVLTAKIGMGTLGLDEAKAAIAEMGALTDAQKAELDGLMIGLELADLDKKMQTRQIEMKDYADKVCGMLEAKRIPSGDEAWKFWAAVANVSMFKKDKALAQRALANLETFPMFSGDNAKRLDRFRSAVEKLPDPESDKSGTDESEEVEEEEKKK